MPEKSIPTYLLSFALLAALTTPAVWGGAPAIAAGGATSLKLNADGTVWAWGDNTPYGVGDGTGATRRTPVQLTGLSGVVSVAAGAAHSLAVKSDGTVWSWGYNVMGQLGDPSRTDYSRPAQVPGLSGIVAVAAGVNHSLALKNDGTVWAWGWNVNEQVGEGAYHQDWVFSPMQVRGLSGVVALAGGLNYSLALKSDGTVWTWGATTLSPVPSPVSGLSGVVTVAGGYRHRLVAKGDGTVWAWGDNDEGQLGDGTTSPRNAPVQVSGLNGVVSLAASWTHSLALKSDGSVWGWGKNDDGELGDGTVLSRLTAVQVVGLRGVVGVATSFHHSVAVRRDGSVSAWGANFSGQLGDGSVARRDLPVRVSALKGITGVAAGADHSLAVMNDGTAWSWGANSMGQLGDGTMTHHNLPARVNGLSGVISVAAGKEHSLAVRNDGSAWAWGDNTSGQLGDGTLMWRKLPTKISGLSGVLAVSGGRLHSLALKNDGTVWAWGANTQNQLGNGTGTPSEVPVPVSGLSGVKAVAAGECFSLALKVDGTVWAWGCNYDGQPGNGAATPGQVNGLSAILAVAAGRSHGLALMNDGTVWAWGANNAAQLGDVPTLGRSQPAPVSGLAGVVAVAAGDDHSLAVKNDGTVWVWGKTNLGIYPDDTPYWSSVPLQVTELTGAAKAAANFHSLVSMADGTLWAWGKNVEGQLGDGDSEYKTAPVQTQPSVPPGARTISLSSWDLSFAARTGANPVVSPAQEMLLTHSGSPGVAWTAVTDRPWLQVSPASGTGSAKLTVSVSASGLPLAGSYTGAVTIMSADAFNAPIAVPVRLQVAAASGGPFGAFETPVDSAAGLSGSIAVTGWALDDIGVNQVTIWRDPVGPEPVYPNGHVYIGDAQFVPGARPDVETQHYSSPNASRAGWGYLLLTNALPGKGNGTYKLHTYAVDVEGNQTKLGTKTIAVDNAHSVKPFGALDYPAPGQTISGSIVGSGWALTPPPASIAADGSTIWVNIDGVNVGHPTFGLPRADVAAYFPGYANNSTSGGQFTLDSTQYTNGIHTIAWIVIDNQGHADGIGSRFFSILNSGGSSTSLPLTPQTRGRTLPGRTTVTGPQTDRLDVPSYRTGYDPGASVLALRTGGDGLYEPIAIAELERIEIRLPEAPEGSAWTGRLRVGNELRPLPAGSTLDQEGGVFYWQLGPGFLGNYQLEFSRHGAAAVTIDVRVSPKGGTGG